jgi:hypothetical protein
VCRMKPGGIGSVEQRPTKKCAKSTVTISKAVRITGCSQFEEVGDSVLQSHLGDVLAVRYIH